MRYYMSKTIDGDVAHTIPRVREALGAEGFGVITEIDVSDTLEAGLGRSFRPYRILGAYDPAFAYEALSQDDKIGLMLPCNVVVQDAGPGRVEIAVIDPLAAMEPAAKANLVRTALAVRDRLETALARI